MSTSRTCRYVVAFRARDKYSLDVNVGRHSYCADKNLLSASTVPPQFSAFSATRVAN